MARNSGSITTTASTGTPPGNQVILQLNTGENQAVFSVSPSSSYSSATCVLEGYDGIAWQQLACSSLIDNTALTTAGIVLPASATSAFAVTVAGFTQARMRALTFPSGTMVVEGSSFFAG